MKPGQIVLLSGLYGGGGAILKAAAFAVSLLVARSVSVEAFGVFGLLIALQSGLSTIALGGLAEGVVGFLHGDANKAVRVSVYRAAYTVSALSFLASVAVFAAIWWISWRRLEVPLSGLVWTVLSAAVLTGTTLGAQFLRLEARHPLSFCFSVVVPASGWCVGYLLFLLFGTIPLFFAGMGVGAGVALLMLIVALGGSSTANAAFDSGVVWRASLPFLLISLLGWLGGYGTNYLIGAIFTVEEIARFTFVLAFASILQLVASAFNQVWAPYFYKQYGRLGDPNVTRRSGKFYTWQAIVLGCIAACVLAIFPALIDQIGGNVSSYRTMSLELYLLLCGYIALGPSWEAQNYFVAAQMGGVLLRTVVITSAIGTASWILAASLWGDVGIYLGFAIQMVVRSIGISFAARRMWGVFPSWIGVLVGTCIGFAGYLLSTLLASMNSMQSNF